jgi:two-component system, NarL family, response regulator LiaR
MIMEEEPSKNVRVLIAEDQELTRVGLLVTLERLSNITVVGEANDGQSAVHQAMTLQPDVVLMDVGMPVMDGIDATQQIKASQPQTKVIMLTTDDSDQSVFAALGAGADGYCLKTIGKEQLRTAISTVNSGAAWLDPAIANRVLRASSKIGTQKPEKKDTLLSPREIEVLTLLVEGLSNQQMAARLFVSAETIKTHMRHIMEKLAVSDRTQAAVKAMKQGLVPG